MDQAADTLDFSRPVAIMLIAVLHFVRDDAKASGLVHRLMDACAGGSFVTISHAASPAAPWCGVAGKASPAG